MKIFSGLVVVVTVAALAVPILGIGEPSPVAFCAALTLVALGATLRLKRSRRVSKETDIDDEPISGYRAPLSAGNRMTMRRRAAAPISGLEPREVRTRLSRSSQDAHLAPRRIAAAKRRERRAVAQFGHPVA